MTKVEQSRAFRIRVRVRVDVKLHKRVQNSFYDVRSAAGSKQYLRVRKDGS